MRSHLTARPTSPVETPDTPDPRMLAAFGGAVIIGGANFVAVSISNRELQPPFGATLRCGLAAVLFCLLAWRRGTFSKPQPPPSSSKPAACTASR